MLDHGHQGEHGQCLAQAHVVRQDPALHVLGLKNQSQSQQAEKRKSELVTYLFRMIRLAQGVMVDVLDLPKRKKKERKKSAIVAKSEGM